MTYSKDDVIRNECKRLVSQGWRPKQGGCHVRLVSPSGKHTLSVPRDGFNRTRQNWLHQVRRIERKENGAA